MASLNSVDMSLNKLWETVKDKQVWHAAVHEAVKSQTRLIDWTTTAIAQKDQEYSIEKLALEETSIFQKPERNFRSKKIPN